jgi:hypothetical protein
MLKHQLLEHWPQPEIIQDVAKNVGFAQFYSKFIPQFELHVSPLCNSTTNIEYTEPITAQELFEDIKQAILLDTCLQHFNYQRLIVLQSNFSSRGFGYVVCQPGNNTASTKAINAYRSGADFSFMTKTSSAVLHPVAFGEQSTLTFTPRRRICW